MINTFSTIFDTFNWKIEKESIYDKNKNDVISALNKDKCTLEDFKALISPAGKYFLEEMAIKSRSITQRRFGKTILLYIPMYLSNECHNICTYCGFSFENKIKRKTLNKEEIIKEIKIIKQYGFEHILLVTGEAKNVGINYFLEVLKIIKKFFSNISFEVQPLKQEEYELLVKEGVYSVLVYQETYNKENYKKYHPKGKKSNFYYRLETPDRLGKANIHKIGLGVLLGLDDWRTDSFFCALHFKYLQKKYWQTKYSISFPRLRPCASSFKQKFFINDSELLQLICAYRLLDEDLELSLSTRESEILRNNLIQLGITTMSAGSKTEPGGYSNPKSALEQFEISDERSPYEIEQIIRKQGYTPVWKDWELNLMNINQE